MFSKTIAISIAALTCVATSAFAAPPTSCFDVAFGAGVQSDYNFRGISQTDKKPGVWGYVEPRCNINKDLQLYGGIWGWSTKLPTDPTGEFDLYAGIRPTFGPLAFDFGFIYYWYPRETQLFAQNPSFTVLGPVNMGFGEFTVADTDFWEVYGKVTWTVNDWLAVGPYIYYSPNWLKTGAKATFVGSTVKLTAPSAWFPADWGGYLSGELAHYWIGDFTAFGVPFDLPDYTTWNAGIGATYKAFTFDVRYYDTDLTRQSCFLLTSDPRGVITAESKWCSATVIGKLSVDLTARDLFK